jgi:hypothetical protein
MMFDQLMRDARHFVTHPHHVFSVHDIKEAKKGVHMIAWYAGDKKEACVVDHVREDTVWVKTPSGQCARLNAACSAKLIRGEYRQGWVAS